MSTVTSPTTTQLINPRVLVGDDKKAEREGALNEIRSKQAGTLQTQVDTVTGFLDGLIKYGVKPNMSGYEGLARSAVEEVLLVQSRFSDVQESKQEAIKGIAGDLLRGFNQLAYTNIEINSNDGKELITKLTPPAPVEASQTGEVTEAEKEEFLDEIKTINEIPNLMSNIKDGNYDYLSSIALGLENLDPNVRISKKDIDESLIEDVQEFINENINKGSAKFNQALEAKLQAMGENKDLYRNLVNNIVINSSESAYTNKIFQVGTKLNESQKKAIVSPLVSEIQADKSEVREPTVQGRKIIAQALDKFDKAKAKTSNSKAIEAATSDLVNKLKQEYSAGNISKRDMIDFANTFMKLDENSNNESGQKSFVDRAREGLKGFEINEESAKSILTFTVLGAGAFFVLGGGSAMKGILSAAISLPQTFMGLYQMYSNFTTDMYVNEQKRKQAEQEHSQEQVATATA